MLSEALAGDSASEGGGPALEEARWRVNLSWESGRELLWLQEEQCLFFFSPLQPVVLTSIPSARSSHRMG